MLITCLKSFGPFRSLSESHRGNGILDTLRFVYVLRGDHKHSSMYRFHTHFTDVNGVILNYGCKVTNNIWNNNK